MSLLTAIFLGIVQGLTVFLPVSSSGHLSVIQNIFHLRYSEAEHMFFEALLHLGTLLAVFIVYKKDIGQIISDTVDTVTGDDEKAAISRGGRLKPNVRMLIFIMVGTLPLLAVLPFYSDIQKLFYNVTFVGFALMATGAILFIADRFELGKKKADSMTFVDSLIIGASQAVASIPGLSRTGATVAAGISMGMGKEFALKFSMLLSIPALIGSIILSLFEAITYGMVWSLLPVYLVGFVFATVTGYFTLTVLRNIISRTRFGILSYYCFGLGVLTLILSLIF